MQMESASPQWHKTTATVATFSLKTTCLPQPMEHMYDRRSETAGTAPLPIKKDFWENPVLTPVRSQQCKIKLYVNSISIYEILTCHVLFPLNYRTFNNQDTVLLRAETDVHVCFLHDNRIFIFKKKASEAEQKYFIIPNPNCDVEYRAASSLSSNDLSDVERPFSSGDFSEQGQSVEELCVGLILHLMTSPKASE